MSFVIKTNFFTEIIACWCITIHIIKRYVSWPEYHDTSSIAIIVAALPWNNIKLMKGQGYTEKYKIQKVTNINTPNTFVTNQKCIILRSSCDISQHRTRVFLYTWSSLDSSLKTFIFCDVKRVSVLKPTCKYTNSRYFSFPHLIEVTICLQERLWSIKGG